MLNAVVNPIRLAPEPTDVAAFVIGPSEFGKIGEQSGVTYQTKPKLFRSREIITGNVAKISSNRSMDCEAKITL